MFERKRIFWFGAHKLLVHTELARLRELGYEVFNPPYLSHVLDQSAVTTWDRKQASTLPPHVFEMLSGYNFFYNTIDPDIAEILNRYFDAVVVTLVARWALEILRVFKGPVLFRTYGQTSRLSDDLAARGGLPLIQGRADFHFLPHCAETGEVEDDWLRERMTVIPYCLSEDVFEARDSWDGHGVAGEILITAPNIMGNPFHRTHYEFLKEYFYQPQFRFLGVQLLGGVDDPQVIGTMHRQAQLALFRRAAGYMYTYRDPRVCYLPPVEMMVFGGPVIYLSGSLLARHIGPGGPGEAKTVTEAHKACARLRERDQGFIDEVRASQRGVVDQYDPALVWPAFDAAMTRLLPGGRKAVTEGLLSTRVFPELSPDWARLRGVAAEVLNGLAEDSAGVERAVSMLDRCLPTRLEVAPQEVIGRENLVRPGALGSGAWMIDLVTQGWMRRMEVGTADYVFFGPFVVLAPGRYEVRFVYRAESATKEPVGMLDVFTGTKARLSEPMRPQGGLRQTSRHVLTVETKGESYEFRVQSFGTAVIELYAVTYQPIVSAAPAELDSMGFLRTDPHGDIGMWRLDPVLGRVGRYVPPGAEGWVQYGPYKPLFPGQYAVTAVLRATEQSDAIAVFDVITATAAYATTTIGAMDLGVHATRLVFDVDEAGIFEFRVHATGATGFYLFSVKLEALAKPPVPFLAAG